MTERRSEYGACWNLCSVVRPNFSSSRSRLFLAALVIGRSLGADGAGADLDAGEEDPGQAVAEDEQRRVDRAAEEHVVVEVEVVLGEPVEVVQLRLDRVGVEGREAPAGAEQVGVVHHGQPRVVRPQPGGHLVVGHQEDLADPRRVHLQRAERVAQLVVGRVARVVGGELVQRCAAELPQGPVAPFLPGGVAAVDPGVDDVDRVEVLQQVRRRQLRRHRAEVAVDEPARRCRPAPARGPPGPRRRCGRPAASPPAAAPRSGSPAGPGRGRARTAGRSPSPRR